MKRRRPAASAADGSTSARGASARGASARGASASASAAAAAASSASEHSKKGQVKRQDEFEDVISESDETLSSCTEQNKQELIRLTTSTPEEITINFVEALEGAHQFLEFKDFLDNCDFIKTDSKREDVFLRLVKMNDRKTRFNKLDEQTIMDSVDARIRELENEEMLRRLSQHRPADAKQENKKRRMLFENSRLEAKNNTFSNPIIELVHQARKGNYMRMNPISELDKIKKSHPDFYNESFMLYKIRSKVQYSESTVMVANISNVHTDAKLRELLLACGEVESIKRKRSDVWPTVAHVTFKNSEAAKIAPFVMGSASIVVERIPESCGTNFALEEGENDSGRHERALAKYSNLRSIYMKRRMEDKV